MGCLKKASCKLGLGKYALHTQFGSSRPSDEIELFEDSKEAFKEAKIRARCFVEDYRKKMAHLPDRGDCREEARIDDDGRLEIRVWAERGVVAVFRVSGPFKAEDGCVCNRKGC